ncbi:MAG: rhodanese-like domain-containing protein [Parvularcula sp.]
MIGKISGLAAAMVAAGLAVLGGAMAKELNFPDVLEGIRTRYDDVKQLRAADLAAMPPENVILVDVRQRKEYDVSHLKGAIRVAPKSRARAVLAAAGGDVSGKTVVFYCSVGERSSWLARRSAKYLKKQGATDVYNLEGGIFGWHNEGRPIYRDGKETRDIHPFNDRWGVLITDRAAITDTPRP